MFTYNIAWVKTGDPYETIDEDIINNNEENWDDDSNVMDRSEESNKSGSKNIGILYTPIGMVPLNEYTDTYKLFNFWTGHADFGITKDISKIIEQTPGVEVLHVFTRYRIRIAVGKMFKPREVFYEIRERINKYFSDRTSS